MAAQGGRDLYNIAWVAFGEEIVIDKLHIKEYEKDNFMGTKSE
jgi:hypothetical protein